jgi:hypothetical protein
LAQARVESPAASAAAAAAAAAADEEHWSVDVDAMLRDLNLPYSSVLSDGLAVGSFDPALLDHVRGACVCRVAPSLRRVCHLSWR